MMLKHSALMILAAVLIILAIVYPFLPGEYDPLAVPVSLMAQVFGPVGLPLTLIGFVWLFMPSRAFVLSVVSLIFGTFTILIVALIATLSVGKILGVLTLATWAGFILLMIPRLKNLKQYSGQFNPAPLYLISLPLVTIVAQLILAKPVTDWSRDRAIAMAAQYTEDIERYYSSHGEYPITLHAQHKDYQTNVVGVEKYFYAPQGEAYNLSFEQPKFFFDRFGTREWVVYNPRDEQRMYSHVAWLLPSGGSEGSQGWYESAETRHNHWRLFYFD